MPKLWTMLENNPTVMNHLARDLGLSPALSFHEIYSLTDPHLLSFIPRPCNALLVIFPPTTTWLEARAEEDKDKPEYAGKGAEEPVMWFKQTIGNACGSIGLVHCCVNGSQAAHIQAGSTLDVIRKEALNKRMKERAEVLYNSEAFEKAHTEAAKMGDSKAPAPEDHKEGGHFIAFVKGDDGRLWELEGGRKGPVDRGMLKDEEDCLSEVALEKGIGGVMKREQDKSGSLRFSVLALGPSLE